MRIREALLAIMLMLSGCAAKPVLLQRVTYLKVQYPLHTGERGCSYGGVRVEAGWDVNDDSQLSGDEVRNSSVDCNVAPELPGLQPSKATSSSAQGVSPATPTTKK